MSVFLQSETGIVESKASCSSSTARFCLVPSARPAAGIQRPETLVAGPSDTGLGDLHHRSVPAYRRDRLRPPASVQWRRAHLDHAGPQHGLRAPAQSRLVRRACQHALLSLVDPLRHLRRDRHGDLLVRQQLHPGPASRGGSLLLHRAHLHRLHGRGHPLSRLRDPFETEGVLALVGLCPAHRDRHSAAAGLLNHHADGFAAGLLHPPLSALRHERCRKPEAARLRHRRYLRRPGGNQQVSRRGRLRNDLHRLGAPGNSTDDIARDGS